MHFPWKTAAAVGVGMTGLALIWREPSLPRIPAPPPAANPAEAEARLRALDAAYGGPVLDLCRHRVWRGAGKSVVVLLHGYTNCPHQFHQLGELLNAAGHTVVAARLPYHGQVNRQPTDLHKMTAPVLAAYLGELLAAAHGLGESITVLGFSFGGVLAAWIAQQRADVEHVVLVSASLGLQAIRPALRRPFAVLRPLYPDAWQWWDPARRDQKLGPPHGYLGYTLHGVATILRLGEAVLAAAQRRRPRVARLTVAVNASDRVVDNGAVKVLAARWRRQGAAVAEVEFGAEHGLIHDLMDPTQPKQQVDKVYPQVAAWLAPTP